MNAPIALRFDVTAAVGQSTSQSTAAWLFVPPTPAADLRLIVCLPGGTYDKRYYHLEIPGHPDYSMAQHLAAAGHVVLAVDHWGVGESTRPDHSGDITPEAVAAANHDVTEQVLSRLRSGTLANGLPARPEATSVGVGHSMGGMLTVLQQARHRTHRQLAILGKSMLAIDRAPFAASGQHPETIEWGEYYWPDRRDLHAVFHFPDVPPEVIAADDAAQVAVPGLLAARTNSGDVATAAAALVDVPVFIAVGEVDTVARPNDEPSYYPACSDITLFRLPGSAHCHNFATTRRLLWDRLIRWIPSTG